MVTGELARATEPVVRVEPQWRERSNRLARCLATRSTADSPGTGIAFSPGTHGASQRVLLGDALSGVRVLLRGSGFVSRAHGAGAALYRLRLEDG